MKQVGRNMILETRYTVQNKLKTRLCAENTLACKILPYKEADYGF